MVTFNEWGEILNERGEVLYVIHQFKWHDVLYQLLWSRFGWTAAVGSNAIPTVPNLVEDEISTSTTEEGSSNADSEEDATNGASDPSPDARTDERMFEALHTPG